MVNIVLNRDRMIVNAKTFVIILAMDFERLPDLH